MSIAALKWARDVRGVGVAARCVLYALADMANDHNECWPSTSLLADRTDLARTTVSAVVGRLERAGLVAVDRRPGRSTIYSLNLSRRTTPGVAEDDSRCRGARQVDGRDGDLSRRTTTPVAEDDTRLSRRTTTPVAEDDTEASRKHQFKPQGSAPPSPPPGGYASEGEPTIPDLESLALSCKPGRRRGTMLTNPEARKLVELADKYGPTAVRDALLEAGGAEMPVAFAAKVLRSRPAERRDEDWDKIGDQRQAERAALRAMTPEQRAERFAPAVAAFARLAKGG